MFQCQTQREKRLHAEGRRDGFHNYRHSSQEPAYKAGFREGILERLSERREGVRHVQG